MELLFLRLQYFDFKNTRLTDASEAAAASRKWLILLWMVVLSLQLSQLLQRLTYGIHANAPTGRTLGDLSVWTSGKTKILEDGTDSGISEDLFDGDIGLTFKTNRTISYTPFATRPSWTVEFSYKWTDINSSTQGRIFGFGNFPGNAWVGGGRRFVNIYRQADKITIQEKEANGGNAITTKYIKSKTTTPTVSDPHFSRQLAHLGNSPDDYIFNHNRR